MHEGTARMGGPMLSIVALLLQFAIAIGPVESSATLESTARHVRTTDSYVTHLLKRGHSRSATFARLVSRLQDSDVIVYVEILPWLPDTMDGRLLLLPRAHAFRYVRVQITLRGGEDDAIALLGHELQHACEIADAPEVGNQTQLARLYERIGQ